MSLLLFVDFFSFGNYANKNSQCFLFYLEQLHSSRPKILFRYFRYKEIFLYVLITIYFFPKPTSIRVLHVRDLLHRSLALCSFFFSSVAVLFLFTYSLFTLERNVFLNNFLAYFK